jgi:hypothetical protein
LAIHLIEPEWFPDMAKRPSADLLDDALAAVVADRGGFDGYFAAKRILNSPGSGEMLKKLGPMSNRLRIMVPDDNTREL